MKIIDFLMEEFWYLNQCRLSAWTACANASTLITSTNKTKSCWKNAIVILLWNHSTAQNGELQFSIVKIPFQYIPFSETQIVDLF